jgi:two-component system chemotaxis sensor kinase CheA
MSEEYSVDLDDMKEIIDDFLIEADELVSSLDENLVKLEETPDDLDLLNEIFRAAHTIKGTSSFLGLDQVSNLTHKNEDILNKLRKGEMTVTPEIMDLLLESVDILKGLLDHVRAGNRDEVPIGDIVERLSAVYKRSQNDTAASNGEETVPEVSGQPEEKQANEMVQLAGVPAASQSGVQRKPAVRVDQTIRVDVKRLDSLMNLMGELVLGRNSMIQSLNTLATENDHGLSLESINSASASINYITTELQLAVMRMRMLPIGKVFHKFPRLVRDLSRESGKQIELLIFGEDTELDKSVIEEIGDPLVHIIRNSCDHGIESPDERAASGKPPKGTVKLTASQEGSNIVIKIEDDGKGLDICAIRDKAVERELVSRSNVDKLSDKEVFRYIFEPGFSTAKKVTDVSGRGVGMDVVRTNIEKLSGLIELESEKGVGTVLTIKLPLTLAIVQGLLIKSDDDVYILPLSSVYETVKTAEEKIYFVNQKPVLQLRDEVIPVVNLGNVYGSSGGNIEVTEKPYIVVVGLADQKLGINIDRFLGQEEVVIKSLGEYLGTTPGIAGATILGDGRIRLIIDLIGLFNLVKRAL